MLGAGAPVTTHDWDELAGLVHAILERIYVADRAVYERLGAERGRTLEQLAAGAITAALRVRFGAGQPHGSPN
jgi:hypothetical protein